MPPEMKYSIALTRHDWNCVLWALAGKHQGAASAYSRIAEQIQKELKPPSGSPDELPVAPELPSRKTTSED
jgi:hypothetical protein